MIKNKEQKKIIFKFNLKIISICLLSYIYFHTNGVCMTRPEEDDRQQLTLCSSWFWEHDAGGFQCEFNHKPLKVDWITNEETSIIKFKNKLFIAHVGSSNEIFLAQSQNDYHPFDFSKAVHLNAPNNPWYTEQRVSLAVFQDKLLLAHVGVNNRFYLGSSEDGYNWPQDKTFEFPEGYYTKLGFDLVVIGDKIALAYVDGRTNKICISLSEGSPNKWPQNPQRTYEWKTKHSMTLNWFNRSLYLAYINETDGEVKLLSSQNGLEWAGPWQVENREMYLNSLSLENTQVKQIKLCNKGGGGIYDNDLLSLFYVDNQGKVFCAINSLLLQLYCFPPSEYTKNKKITDASWEYTEIKRADPLYATHKTLISKPISFDGNFFFVIS